MLKCRYRLDWLFRLVKSDHLFGFLLAVAFDPFTYTGATVPRWALLAVALPLLCAFQSRKNLTITHALGGLFIAWASLTLSWSANLWDGLNGLIQLLMISLALVYGSRLKDLEGIFIGLSLGVTVSSSLLLIHPIFTFTSIVQTYPHGLFGNRNMLGEAAVLTALGCLVYRRYWFIPGLLPAIFWPPVTRGAILALVTGVCVWLWPRSKLGTIALVVSGCAIPLILFGADYRFSSVAERFDVWRMVWSGVTPLGHGIGSTFALTPYLGGHWDSIYQRIDHVHNEALEILFELGIPGIVLYIAIITNALGCSIKESTLGNPAPVLVAFLVISSVAFPWHIATNAFIGAVVLGHSIRNGRSLRSLYDDWRTLLRRWHEFGWQAIPGQYRAIKASR